MVDPIPVLTWLHETGEAMFSLPEKYYTRLAGIGAVVGLIYGVYAGNLKMIPVTTLCGLIAGGGLLHIIGALLMLGALLLGLAIFLTLLAAFVGLILSGDETGRISQRRKIAHM